MRAERSFIDSEESHASWVIDRIFRTQEGDEMIEVHSREYPQVAFGLRSKTAGLEGEVMAAFVQKCAKLSSSF